MADTKISALPAITVPALTDEIPVNQGGTTKKETIAQILGLGIQRVTRVISSAEILAIAVTPITLLSAPGADLYYIPLLFSASINYAGVAYAGGNGFALYYGTVASNFGVGTGSVPTAMYTPIANLLAATADAQFSLYPGGSLAANMLSGTTVYSALATNYVNKALTFVGDAVTLGTSPVTVDLIYITKSV